MLDPIKPKTTGRINDRLEPGPSPVRGNHHESEERQRVDLLSRKLACLLIRKDYRQMRKLIDQAENQDATAEQIPVESRMLADLITQEAFIGSINKLERHNIRTVGDLIKYTPNEVIQFRSIGAFFIHEAQEQLEKIGVFWGIPEEDDDE